MKINEEWEFRTLMFLTIATLVAALLWLAVPYLD